MFDAHPLIQPNSSIFRRASKNTWVEGWPARWPCKARMLETRNSRILDRGFLEVACATDKTATIRVSNELTEWRTEELM